MSKVNLYIDCTNGISGDMLCQCLIALCETPTFVEGQQQIVSDELGRETGPENEHKHGHSHPQAYTHRSFQGILSMLEGCQLNDEVKAMTLKIYTILAIAEAEVHGETLETVHFHEVGRPQAIINMVGIAAALVALNPNHVYCSKVMDGTGTVQCAHGEISVPVPAVRALMNRSALEYGTSDIKMEMVTPTGLAALLAIGATHLDGEPVEEIIVKSTVIQGTKRAESVEQKRGLRGMLIKDIN